MKSGLWIIIVIVAAGLGFWAGYDIASKPPKEVVVVKEVPAPAAKSESGSAAPSGGYGAPAAAPSGGYGAPAAAPSGGYGAPAKAPSGGYGQ